MALTAMLAKDSADLQAHAALQFSSGGYHYEIKIKAGESSYSVTDGTNTFKTSLVWAFGSGPVGQTYLFQRVNGEIFEARVSYFDALQGLDFTPMLVVISAGDLESAAARFVGPEERIRCFSCHATGSTIAGRFGENGRDRGGSGKRDIQSGGTGSRRCDGFLRRVPWGHVGCGFDGSEGNENRAI